MNVNKINEYEVEIDFDFPAWLSENHLPLESFKKQSKYLFNNDNEKISYLRGQIKAIYGKDKNRAFNRYLMQYVSKGANFFEKRYEKIVDDTMNAIDTTKINGFPSVYFIKEIIISPLNLLLR